jgi:hypothetical protein
MGSLTDTYVAAKLVGGVVLPLAVLAFAVRRVDPALLAGTTLALGGTFAVVAAYARYVDLDGVDSASPWSRHRDGAGAENRRE